MEIKIAGGGLAGAEAAYQIALRGIDVTLYEMRPASFSPAHKTSWLAELVCSNSMKSKDLSNAHGLLKEELSILDSLVVRIARETAIPGGKALVVNREKFARRITEEIEDNPRIRVVREEIEDIPSGTIIIATGPLTSEKLTEKIKTITGEEHLSFFDAISPVIEADSIDMKKAFYASRYIKEKNDDYLNCPLSEEEYTIFYNELINAKRVEFKDFEKTSHFEGCLPIEVMAERGKQTLLYGPMKPVGLIDEYTGKRPFAVIQLRKENEEGTMFNLVGFQTKLTYQEQDRVLRLVPAMKKAAFLRYGSVHRNTYIHAPAVLNTSLQMKQNGNVFFAGQITGVEGYMESTSMGLVAGISACLHKRGIPFIPPPHNTCVGGLLRYITTETNNFQPMNVNFGLLKDYQKKYKEMTVDRALQAIALWKKRVDEDISLTSAPDLNT